MLASATYYNQQCEMEDTKDPLRGLCSVIVYYSMYPNTLYKRFSVC